MKKGWNMDIEDVVRTTVLSSLPGWKDNPNNYETINKWNRRIYQKHKHELFHKLEPIIHQAIDDAFEDCPIDPNFETLVDFRAIEDNTLCYRSNAYSALHFNPEAN